MSSKYLMAKAFPPNSHIVRWEISVGTMEDMLSIGNKVLLLSGSRSQPKQLLISQIMEICSKKVDYIDDICLF